MKRWMMWVVVLVLMLGVVAPASAQTWDWKKYSGKTIRYVATNFQPTKAIEKQIPRFEQETGIKVNVETYPDDPYRQKLRSEFTAGNSTVDIFQTLVGFDALQFVAAGWYYPLDEFMKNVPPGYDWNDYGPSVMGLTRAGGKQVGIPLHSETQVMMYNKELFAKAGLTRPPRTFDEATAFAAKINDPQNKVYGIVNRGKRMSNSAILAPILYGYCGKWQDDQGNLTWNTPAGHQAFKVYAEQLGKYGPPGVLNYHFQETAAFFAQGRAGMFWDSTSTPGLLEDPKASLVKGKVGYAVVPAGPCGVKPGLLAWGWSIPAQAPNKEAAWYLIVWLSQKAQVAERAAKDMIFPARGSTWDDPSFKQAAGALYPPDYLTTFRDSLPIGVPNIVNPQVKATSQVRELISDVIAAAVEDVYAGKDPMPTIRAKAASTEAEANRLRNEDSK
jgi:multiple sugar transport system substrate-binding protein